MRHLDDTRIIAHRKDRLRHPTVQLRSVSFDSPLRHPDPESRMPGAARSGHPEPGRGVSFDRRWPALSLVVLAILTMCLGLGRQAITDSDEAFYAEASREMVESGDWLTPHFNYEERWEKPVLYYWFTA